jgi:transposase
LIRLALKDEQWEQIAPLVPGKEGDPGRSGEDNRLFLEAVLWIARTGSPWRDLPEYFGEWFSVWKRFRRWALKAYDSNELRDELSAEASQPFPTASIGNARSPSANASTSSVDASRVRSTGEGLQADRNKLARNYSASVCLAAALVWWI